MATKINIINSALTKLGSERLMSETDNNAASRAVEAVYDGVLLALLRDYRWSFAIKRAKLAAMSDAPEFGYLFQYELPSDCLRVDMVNNQIYGDWQNHGSHHHEYQPQTPGYQIEGRKILTDIEAPLLLRYGSNVDDPSLYDSSFADTMACALAAELAESITQATTKKQSAQQDLEIALRRARQTSAIERPRIIQQDTSWYTARL